MPWAGWLGTLNKANAGGLSEQMTHTSWRELGAPLGKTTRPVPYVHRLLAKRKHESPKSIGGDGWDMTWMF